MTAWAPRSGPRVWPERVEASNAPKDFVAGKPVLVVVWKRLPVVVVGGVRWPG